MVRKYCVRAIVRTFFVDHERQLTSQMRRKRPQAGRSRAGTLRATERETKPWRRRRYRFVRLDLSNRCRTPRYVRSKSCSHVLPLSSDFSHFAVMVSPFLFRVPVNR